MSFYTMADNNVPITANRDGALYNVALSNQSFIIKDMGNEYAPSVTGLEFSVGTGIAVLKGRHITSQIVTSDNTLTLPPNTSGYVVLRLDLSRPLGSEAYLFATPTPTQENINWGGVIYDMPIATYTSTTTNATIEDVRVIKETATPPIDIEAIKLQVMEAIYPIGSIYTNYTNTNPNTILGFGTWTNIATTLVKSVTENVFGNGKSLAITDGTKNYGFFGAYTGSGMGFAAWDGSYGANVGPNGQSGYQMNGSRNWGVPTKTQLGSNPSYSGLIVERSSTTCYLWRRTA